MATAVAKFSTLLCHVTRKPPTPVIIKSSQLSGNPPRRTEQEAFDTLKIAWNPDGRSLTRTVTIPMVPPTPWGPAPTSAATPPIFSKDLLLGPRTPVPLRLYLPSAAVGGGAGRKLPVIINIHGGDFVLYSNSTVIYHNFCNDVASLLPAVVVSVEYRLAPEHRLPAAYDDALNAILWTKDQALANDGRDPWMEFADFSRTFLLGSSSGANIAYHAALRMLDFDLQPLQIRGLIMNQAFFGGSSRTNSEIKLQDDKYVPLYVTDTLWSLALPCNATRDHEFCNPISVGTYGDRVNRLPEVYIKGDEGDPLIDREVQLAEFLQSCGVSVYHRFNSGGFHGIELQNKEAAQELYNDIKNFVNDDTCRNLNSEPICRRRDPSCC